MGRSALYGLVSKVEFGFDTSKALQIDGDVSLRFQLRDRRFSVAYKSEVIPYAVSLHLNWPIFAKGSLNKICSLLFSILNS